MRHDEVEARWESWSGDVTEVLRFGFENGGWTADGTIRPTGGTRGLQYVIRTDSTWQVTQFMLFRDLDEPDLWLARDRAGLWGEVNGAQRPDLGPAIDIDLTVTPFTKSVSMRRLDLPIDEGIEIVAASVDTETLAVVPTMHHYSRTGTRTWRFRGPTTAGGVAEEVALTVDEHGLVIDQPGHFRRVA